MASKISLTISLIFISLSSSLSHNNNNTLSIYNKWLITNNKVHYSISEKQARFNTFKDNLMFIKQHNLLNRSYKLGLNRFADMTNDEYRVRVLGRGYLRNKGRISERYLYREDDEEKNTRAVSVDDFEQNDEKSLQKVVAGQPVSVAIEAGGRDFQLYESGVFTGSCGTKLDHSVVVVGYGTENGLDYWIVRNSWGPNWGESGYIKMKRNIESQGGNCGITKSTSYPTKNRSKSRTVCDDDNSCPEGTTCCCVYQYGEYCFGWGCCLLESAICCDDHASCCPKDYPVCDLDAGTCLMHKNNPWGVKTLKRIAARPIWPKPGKKFNSA